MERRKGIGRAKKLAKAITILSIVNTLVLVFWRNAPTTLVLLPLAMSLGILALKMLAPDTYTLYEKRQERVYAGLGVALVSNLIASAIPACRYNIIDWSFIHPIAIVTGLLLMAAIAHADKAILADKTLLRQRFSLLLLTPFCIAWGYSVVLTSNGMFDDATPQQFRTTVVGKYISRSSKGGTFYNFTLAPWGPVKDKKNIDIECGLYGQIPEGGQVCIDLRPGLIGAAWYKVRRCGA